MAKVNHTHQLGNTFLRMRIAGRTHTGKTVAPITAFHHVLRGDRPSGDNPLTAKVVR